MRFRALVAAALVVVAAAAAASCADDERAADPGAPVVPDAGADSAVFEVPLPEGAVRQDSPGGTDRYRARKGQSMRGLQAFFGEEVGGKPFRGHAWCGATSNADNTKYVLVWRKADTNDLIRLGLDGTDPAVGVAISIAEEKDAPPILCPPGPIDSIPGDPGDIPGV